MRAPSADLARLLTPDFLEQARTLDIERPAAGQAIACWFCYRSGCLLWYPGIWRCATNGSCRRYYVAVASHFTASPMHTVCNRARCRSLVFRLRAGTTTRAAERTCTHCGDRQPLSFPLDRVGLLTDPADRAALRASDDLSAAGGPTFRQAKINDRRTELEREAARLGTARAREELRRYVYQSERRRRNRIERGQDPDRDARRFHR